MNSRILKIKSREVTSLRDLFNGITGEEVAELALKLNNEDIGYLFSDSSEFHEENEDVWKNLPSLKFTKEQLESLKESSRGPSSRGRSDAERCVISGALVVPACFWAVKSEGQNSVANKVCRDQIKDFTNQCSKTVLLYLQNK